MNLLKKYPIGSASALATVLIGGSYYLYKKAQHHLIESQILSVNAEIVNVHDGLNQRIDSLHKRLDVLNSRIDFLSDKTNKQQS